MKLWDVLATCLLLLSSAVARPLHQNTPPAKRTYFPSSSSDSAWLSAEDEAQTFQREKHSLQELSMEDQCKNRCPMASRSRPLDLNKPGRCLFVELFRFASETFLSANSVRRSERNVTADCPCSDKTPRTSKLSERSSFAALRSPLRHTGVKTSQRNQSEELLSQVGIHVSPPVRLCLRLPLRLYGSQSRDLWPGARSQAPPRLQFFKEFRPNRAGK